MQDTSPTRASGNDNTNRSYKDSLFVGPLREPEGASDGTVAAAVSRAETDRWDLLALMLRATLQEAAR